jgi:hypothetical protein
MESPAFTHVFNEFQRALACVLLKEPDTEVPVRPSFLEDVLRRCNDVCGSRVLAYAGERCGQEIDPVLALDLGSMVWTPHPIVGIETDERRTEMVRTREGCVFIEYMSVWAAIGGVYDPHRGEFRRLKNRIAAWSPSPFVLCQYPNGNIGAIFPLPEDLPHLYTPESNEWQVVKKPTPKRNMPCAVISVMLANGTVLFTGGSKNGAATGHTERWNPNTENLKVMRRGMLTPRMWHAAVLLPSGHVLVSGGYTVGEPEWKKTAECEIYDPFHQQWRGTGRLVSPRAHHCMVLLPSLNMVLALGGVYNHRLPPERQAVTCEFYDIAAGGWSRVAMPAIPRSSMKAVVF